MKKETVALIFGSPAAEYSVSLHSAASVMRHFPFDQYNLVSIAITQDNRWLSAPYTSDDLDNDHIADHPQAQEVSLALNNQFKGFYVVGTGDKIVVDRALLIIHGPYGEGGSLQGLLSCAQIPYTGSHADGSFLCMDKEVTHLLAEAAGIPMARYQVVYRNDQNVSHNLGYPCVVKPSGNGSSFGISIVYSEDELQAAIDEAFKFDQKVLIEEFLKGMECGCSALLDGDSLIVSVVDGIVLTDKDYFDFNEKYSSNQHLESYCPAPLPEGVAEKIQTMVRTLYRVLHVRQFGRFDFFYTKDGNVYLNEVNTIPGFTASSRYPRMMAHMGLSYQEVVTKLIEGACYE